MRLHVLPRWGECEIEDICPDDLQEWIDSFELAGAAEKAFKCLRQIIRWWVRKKRLHIVDPTAYIELNSREPYRPEVLDATEVSEMLRGMWGHWANVQIYAYNGTSAQQFWLYANDYKDVYMWVRTA